MSSINWSEALVAICSGDSISAVAVVGDAGFVVDDVVRRTGNVCATQRNGNREPADIGTGCRGAILLILEFYTPYRGLIEVSSAPLRAALGK